MKKLVMMCAIVATAISVHAASFEWGGAIANEAGDDTLPSGLNAYLLYSDSAFGTINSFNTSTMGLPLFFKTCRSSRSSVIEPQLTALAPGSVR